MKLCIQNISFQCYIVKYIGDSIPLFNPPSNHWLYDRYSLAQNYAYGYSKIYILIGLPGPFKVIGYKRINLLLEMQILLPTELVAVLFGGQDHSPPKIHLAFPPNCDIDIRLKNIFRWKKNSVNHSIAVYTPKMSRRILTILTKPIWS